MFLVGYNKHKQYSNFNHAPVLCSGAAEVNSCTVWK